MILRLNSPFFSSSYDRLSVRARKVWVGLCIESALQTVLALLVSCWLCRAFVPFSVLFIAGVFGRCGTRADSMQSPTHTFLALRNSYLIETEEEKRGIRGLRLEFWPSAGGGRMSALSNQVISNQVISNQVISNQVICNLVIMLNSILGLGLGLMLMLMSVSVLVFVSLMMMILLSKQILFVFRGLIWGRDFSKGLFVKMKFFFFSFLRAHCYV